MLELPGQGHFLHFRVMVILHTSVSQSFFIRPCHGHLSYFRVTVIFHISGLWSCCTHSVIRVLAVISYPNSLMAHDHSHSHYWSRSSTLIGHAHSHLYFWSRSSTFTHRSCSFSLILLVKVINTHSLVIIMLTNTSGQVHQHSLTCHDHSHTHYWWRSSTLTQGAWSFSLTLLVKHVW